MNQFIINDFRSADVAEAASLHLRAFPGFFLSRLGLPFVRELYASFAADESTIGLVARDQSGRLAGLAVGSVEPAGFFRRALLRRWWRFAFASLRMTLRQPKTIPRLLVALRHRGWVPSGVQGALLSSICVDPTCQRLGLGRQLLETWTMVATKQGAQSAYLTTDAVGNEVVNALYRETGWALVDTFTTRENRAMNCYLKPLTSPGSGS